MITAVSIYFVKGTITVRNTVGSRQELSNSKKIIFKNCVPLTSCIDNIQAINNIQIYDVQYIDAVMDIVWKLFKNMWDFISVL